MTSIEPTAGKINDVCVFKDSGLLLLALDCSQIPSYFIPDLGPTPKWCSPIESMTVFLIFRFSFFFHFIGISVLSADIVSLFLRKSWRKVDRQPYMITTNF